MGYGNINLAFYTEEDDSFIRSHCAMKFIVDTIDNLYKYIS